MKMIAAIEPLEARRMLAAAAHVHLHKGVVMVSGTNHSDTVVITADATHVRVDANFAVTMFERSKVRGIEVRGRAGDDSLFVDDVDGVFNIPVTLLGGRGMDMLNGGAGNDLLDGGADDDFMFGMGGHDTMHGGRGHDLMTGGDGNDHLYGDAGDD